ncbi:MAG: response regulator transcription factor [Flavobacteriaceae bacterium]|nr:response regulator transcription factor [Flavobacteriaceae bacterium]
MKHSVVIVDDHVIFSQALTSLINTFENFEVIYTCKNGIDLMDKLKFEKNIPDVILMDTNMPQMNGFESMKWISNNHPDLKVLALSLEESEYAIIKMLKAGAKGYLLKDIEKTELETALNELINSGFYHSSNVTKVLIKSVMNEEPEINLKDNEIKFMQLACSEMTYKEIADTMCLSPKTIDGYRDTLFEKLNVKNRTGLVIYAIKNKFFAV